MRRVSEQTLHYWYAIRKRQDLSKCTHLPHGFNAFFEQVEVTMTGQVTRPDHVTIETPELLHLGQIKKCLHWQLCKNESAKLAYKESV